MKITLLLAALLVPLLVIAQEKNNPDSRMMRFQYAAEILNFNTSQDSSKIDFYFKRGCIHQDYSDFKAAIKDYNKAIDTDPENYKAYHNRGMCKMDLKLIKDAIADFSKSIEIKPNSWAYTNRALCKSMLDDYDNAINDAAIAITYDPENVAAHNLIGISLIKLGKKEEGCKYLQKAFSLDKNKDIRALNHYCK